MVGTEVVLQTQEQEERANLEEEERQVGGRDTCLVTVCCAQVMFCRHAACWTLDIRNNTWQRAAFLQVRGDLKLTRYVASRYIS